MTERVIDALEAIDVEKQDAELLLGTFRLRQCAGQIFAILAISATILLAAIWLLVLTQPLPFLDLLFEAISAFATVGITRGITDDLNTFGQGLIMLLMFVGRVGSLTLAYTFATATPSRVQYPRAEVYVG